MTAVFSHGRLRLYLLKLLDDGPKHGYELIRLLEERFHGHYAPSAGTIYPRLQRMETEGLVRHTAAGGRKTYEITDTGRAELRQRANEVADLERDIKASLRDLAALGEEIQQGYAGRPATSSGSCARPPGRPASSVAPAGSAPRPPRRPRTPGATRARTSTTG